MFRTDTRCLNCQYIAIDHRYGYMPIGGGLRYLCRHCLTLLFLLSIAVQFPVGRVLFAVLVSVICLSAECFALFKVAQFL
jgi:hypothetical protein